MKGRLTKLPDGTLTAQLVDALGYISTLTGTRVDGGYDVEIVLVGVPEGLAVPGDEAWFEVVRK